MVEVKESDIDVVVLWVDDNDPKWLADKEKYLAEEGKVFTRRHDFRDWGIFKYWFRGICKNMPWVRKIHFVTYGHVPDWLDITNEKIHIVNHEDIMPKEILPTFNSAIIESHIYKIDGLAEKFIYFNDDIFVTKPMKPDDFFHNGLPRDILAFQPVIANESYPIMTHTFINNSLAICKHFNKREHVKKNLGKYFKIGYPPMYFFYNMLEMAFPRYTGFFTPHGPAPYLKKTFIDVWNVEGDTIRDMFKSRFKADNNVNQYLFRIWQCLKGDFVPTNILRKFRYIEMKDLDKVVSYVAKQKQSVICINDSELGGYTFEEAKKRLIESFDSILGEKCKFEK